MSEEYYQELLRLRNLSCVPSVRQMLEDMIKNQPQLKTQQEKSIREPIKRSKPHMQTIFITKGYAWSQSPSSVSFYIPLENANQIPKTCYTLTLSERSVELNIACPQKGATYNFKVGQLYDRIKLDNPVMKYKVEKIVIILQKSHYGLEWTDLRSKSTQATYNELERYEKQYQSITPEHLSAFFGATAPTSGICSHLNDKKSCNKSHIEPKR